MADPKPNQITACNLGLNGEKEFVVACKGRPFSILTSPLLPVPAVTYLDYDLVRDLNLRMSSLQCRKLFYCGEKLRILGHLSTTVQCIIDGSPLGNIQMKCHVVEDLKKKFNTHGIAGDKLHRKFVGQHAEMFPAKASDEPTDEEEADEKPKKKKRKKSKKTDAVMPDPKTPAQPRTTPSDRAAPPSPPRPLCQGIWTKSQSYHGWHPEHGYGGPPGVLRDCYQDRRSGQVQAERPDCWDSEGPFHCEDSASSVYESSDEYTDEYTNISHIRQNVDSNICSIHANEVSTNQAMTAHPPPFLTVDEAREAVTANAAAIAKSSPASPKTIVKMMTMNCQKAGMNAAETRHALQCAGINTNKQTGTVKKAMISQGKQFTSGTVKEAMITQGKPFTTTEQTKPVEKAMISQGKPFTKEDLRHVTTLRREGKDVPPSLKHVPSLHGPKWCHADCNKRKLVPLQCGYHESWGPVYACSPLCNGGHCDHNDDPDYYEEQDAGDQR